MTDNPEDEIIAEINALAAAENIDAIVDRQLAQGEPDYDQDNPWCSCGAPWHGLPLGECPGTHQAGETEQPTPAQGRDPLYQMGVIPSPQILPMYPRGLSLSPSREDEWARVAMRFAAGELTENDTNELVYALDPLALRNQDEHLQGILVVLLTLLNVPTDSPDATRLLGIMADHPEIKTLGALHEYLSNPEQQGRSELEDIARQLAVRLTAAHAIGPHTQLQPGEKIPLWRRPIATFRSRKRQRQTDPVPFIYEIVAVEELIRDEARRFRQSQQPHAPHANRIISITDEGPEQEPITLGYIPVTADGATDDARINSYPEPLTRLRFHRHDLNGAVIETGPISPADAARLLLRVCQPDRAKHLLHTVGIPGFIAHFRTHPGPPPFPSLFRNYPGYQPVLSLDADQQP
ncbi:Uncharacterised protein [Mycobacteroides abscessus subsp. abscessus]|nr:Uncharacterised protein [Mycobacteroides abscessus subsp. abscessus]SIC81270.1 Uncharacterised protein [Mycobacteroides abscessus subsp. abscessus]SKP25412.1 Uncharacterised protein [Mycobacteroides abscessus subsp. abscessus]